MFHPYAWLLWVAAALLAALLTRNPLYLLLIGGSVGLVYQSLPGRRSPLAESWMGLVKLGALVTLFAVPLNALTVHAGRYVVASLPAHWPIIGGPITVEALLFGLSTSLSLTVILLIFAVFNVALDQSTLVRLTPPFLLEAGVVVAIAVSFAPQMVRAFHAIREAQLIRGRRRTGLRDWGPLFVALLTTGLERSMALAESMESRGFGGVVRAHSTPRRLLVQALTLVALAVLAMGLFWTQYRGPWSSLGWVAVLAGVGLLGGILWDQGRRVARSRYSRQLWRPRDRVMLLVSALILVGLAGVRLGRPEWLLFYPYPPNPAWPAFHFGVGALLLFLSTPVWLQP